MTSPYSAARWHAPLATTGLWALAAGAAVFWALRLSSPADAVAAAAAMPRPSVTADAEAVGRLLGVVSAQTAAPAAPEAASRFALVGVVADPSNQGAALIAIDGKPPKPFRVGSRVGDNYVLQSVGVRAATLGAQVDGPPAFTLQLPVRAPIGVGLPPPPISGVSPAPVPAQRSAGVLPSTMPAVVMPPATPQPETAQQQQPQGQAPAQGAAQ
jgi:general secretion pathway protein C